MNLHSLFLPAFAVALVSFTRSSLAAQTQPIPIIFDTDVGNDVDDVLALGMIHGLQSRGECRLAAVTVTKDHSLTAPFVDCVNTFYGRPDIPIGVCRSGVTPDEGKFLRLTTQRDGDRLRYPHDLQSSGDAPSAVDVLRRALAAEADGSVIVVQVGFSTNLARLLGSPADAISDLPGRELIKTKVRLLSIMAGEFASAAKGQSAQLEYNVINDIPAAQVLAEQWPTPILWSGFEIGLALPYPHQSIERDFAYVAHHPLVDSYVMYEPPPHDRPTWDLTSVLAAIRPDHEYFDLSPPGRVVIRDDGRTNFVEQPSGPHRRLVLRSEQRARVIEALQLLSSQPAQ